jgi:hypothetical protein
MPLSDSWPDLRNLRYVLLSPDARAPKNGMRLRGFAIVPWGIVLDAEEQVAAIRWSGIHDLDIQYRATHDGTVRTRVEVATVRGCFVGWAWDAHFTALAGQLHDVAASSSRALAVNLEGSFTISEGDPFVERVLDAARRIVHVESETELCLEARGYRAARGTSLRSELTAAALRSIDLSCVVGAPDPSALIAAIAGELRLASFLPELSRLVNAPHPAVAAIARASLGRIETVAWSDTDEALGWFVPPDELSRLCTWRDAR